MGAHLPFIYLNPLADYTPVAQQSISELKSCISYASDIGSRYVVFHASGFSKFKTKKRAYDSWVTIVEELLNHAQKKNIILSIENASHFLSLSRLSQFVRQFNSPHAKITLDIGHAHFRICESLIQHKLQSLMDRYLPFWIIKKNISFHAYGTLENFIKNEADIINNIHLHDYDGRKDHLCCGEGKINFSFLNSLVGFDVPIIIETDFSTSQVSAATGIGNTLTFLKKFGIH